MHFRQLAISTVQGGVAGRTALHAVSEPVHGFRQVSYALEATSDVYLAGHKLRFLYPHPNPLPEGEGDVGNRNL